MKIIDLLNSNCLKVEIADTPSAHETGLMYRKKLDEDRGMLFVFNKPQKLSFWGQNTYIPLDIAFISDKNIITKISHISPFSTKPILSDENCNRALEANYGYFDKNKIKVGDSININNDGIEIKINFA